MSRIYTPLQLYQWFINNYSYRKCIITHHKYKFVHSINFCFFSLLCNLRSPFVFHVLCAYLNEEKNNFRFHFNNERTLHVQFNEIEWLIFVQSHGKLIIIFAIQKVEFHNWMFCFTPLDIKCNAVWSHFVRCMANPAQKSFDKQII